MATQNLTLLKTDGWKKISEAARIYAMTPQNTILECAWAASQPSEEFVGYPISPGLGIARDFEVGHLYLRLPEAANFPEATIILDEG